ncbi:hypothetical protein Taro_008283 [Colocasia esculenta]|uniref:Uncharacterized protein n=1 Tax=Colocasia esculenta TaxID=4460 RepID=A0A843U1F2_COLES|nr:hypothetical protein [Colocasia esculenta]
MPDPSKWFRNHVECGSEKGLAGLHRKSTTLPRRTRPAKRALQMTPRRCPHCFPLLLQVRDLSTPTSGRTPSNRRAGLGVPVCHHLKATPDPLQPGNGGDTETVAITARDPCDHLRPLTKHGEKHKGRRHGTRCNHVAAVTTS